MHIYSTQSLGKLIKQKRREMKMTQKEFAGIVDLHRTYIGAIERGEKNITLETLVNLLQSLNLKLYVKINTSEL
jgi:transcriptional regulator with XRE-family HTH domain